MTPLQLNAIPLLSGSFFCPFDPSSEMMARLTWPDLAWGMANAPRFGAQTAARINVGAHTLCVHAAAKRLGLTGTGGLLHDAAEGILGDVPTPFKRHPAYAQVVAVEEALQRAINVRFGVAPDAHKGPIVKDADNFALAVEAWIGHGADVRDWGYEVSDRWVALRSVAEDHVFRILNESRTEVFDNLLDAGVEWMLCTEAEACAAFDLICAPEMRSASETSDMPWWPVGGPR